MKRKFTYQTALALLRRIRAMAVIFVLSCSIICKAQDKAVYVSVGSSSQIDTYLSQEHYKGAELRFIHNTKHQSSKHPLWHEWEQQVQLANTQPRSENASMLFGQYSLTFALYCQWSPAQNLTLSAGGAVEGFIGGLYNTRNGNNPAQLKTGINIAPAIDASYGFTIKKLTRRAFRAEYRAMMPLVGVHFSPAYGQSYYEIFARGNYDHNICLASPANALSLQHRLTLDIPVSKRNAIIVGYLGDYRQANHNNLNYHDYYHSGIIGLRF